MASEREQIELRNWLESCAVGAKRQRAKARKLAREAERIRYRPGCAERVKHLDEAIKIATFYADLWDGWAKRGTWPPKDGGPQ